MTIEDRLQDIESSLEQIESDVDYLCSLLEKFIAKTIKKE